MIRRLATGLVAVIALAALAGAAGAFTGSKKGPTSITIWVGWSKSTHEFGVFKSLIAEYNRKHTSVKVTAVSDINDDKIIAAIRSGSVPDVVSSFASSNVGSYCSSGGWVNLGPFLKKSHVDMKQFPSASLYYTQYNGVRCALPLLADDFGLYYNKTLFKKAGITRPPHTISELTGDAYKLTQKNKDGSLKVVGYDPAFAFYDDVPPKYTFYAPLFGAKYTDAKGHSILAKDPAWKRFLSWQKSLVDWYGYDKLQRFQAGLGQEFSSSNGFETGKLAMNIDGEAWDLVRYLTTNTHFLAQFSNGIRNVPSTLASLHSPEIKPDAHFATFLKIFGNPHSATTPITAVGAGYQDLIQAFVVKWQAGHVKDLAGGLKNLDKQIDAQLAQAKKGGGGPP
jgi:multiple sugar transport system substrate-binding protein